MNLLSTVDLFKQQLAQADLSQWAVLILGTSEVLLARKNNIWLYPTGIASIILSGWGLFEAQLYAEFLLSLYYLVMSIYGWWFWFTKKEQPPVPITSATRNEWFTTLAIVFLGWLLLYITLKVFTPSTVPIWDAWVSSTAWAGMWLLARRKVENWILLNISNIFAVPLLFYKALPLYGVLTIILFTVACFGYVDWKRSLKKISSPAIS